MKPTPKTIEDKKVEKGTLCVRCGSKRYERPSGCSAWGKNFIRHRFMMQKYEVVTIKPHE